MVGNIVNAQKPVGERICVVGIGRYVLAGTAIIRNTELGEVAVLVCNRRDVGRACRVTEFVVPLLRPEDKQLVSDDGAVNDLAPVVAAEDVLLDAVETVEIVGGV